MNEHMTDKDLAEAVQWAAQKSLVGVHHALVELQERRAADTARGAVGHVHKWAGWTDEQAVHRQLRRCDCGEIQEWNGDGWQPTPRRRVAEPPTFQEMLDASPNALGLWANFAIGGTVSKTCSKCGNMFFGPAGMAWTLCSFCTTNALPPEENREQARGAGADAAWVEWIEPHLEVNDMPYEVAMGGYPKAAFLAGYAAGSRDAEALREAARDALDAHSFDCCPPMQRLKAALIEKVPRGMEELRGGLRGH